MVLSRQRFPSSQNRIKGQETDVKAFKTVNDKIRAVLFHTCYWTPLLATAEIQFCKNLLSWVPCYTRQLYHARILVWLNYLAANLLFLGLLPWHQQNYCSIFCAEGWYFTVLWANSFHFKSEQDTDGRPASWDAAEDLATGLSFCSSLLWSRTMLQQSSLGKPAFKLLNCPMCTPALVVSPPHQLSQLCSWVQQQKLPCQKLSPL